MNEEPVDLSGLSLEVLPDVVEKLQDACFERLSIVRACGSEWESNNDGTWYLDNYPIAEKESTVMCRRINALATFVERLSRYYLDVDAEYIAGSYSNFPKSLRSALVTSTDYPIGTQTLFRCETFTDATMDKYKTLLTNCAYWLNKMTKIVLPSSRMCFKRKASVKSGGADLSVVPEIVTLDEYSSPIGEYRVGSVTYWNWSYTFYGYEQEEISYSHDSQNFYLYDGVVIDNRAPYPAAVDFYLTLPKVSESNWSATNKWQGVEWEMYIATSVSSEGEAPYESYYATSTKKEYGSQAFIGGGLGNAYTTYLKTIIDNGTVKTTHSENTNYTHDGSQSYVYLSSDLTSDSTLGNHASPENSLNVWTDFRNSGDIWTGLGLWTDPSQPIRRFIPANTKKEILDICGSGNYRPPFLLRHFSPAGWTRGSHGWEEHRSVSYDWRLIPVMDFSDSITMFAIGDEEEE